MAKARWYDLGQASILKNKPLRQIEVDGVKIALSFRKGVFAAVSGECNHVKGPLGKGSLKGDYIVCPWHSWKFHRKTGRGEAPYDKACLPRHEVKLKDGHLFVNLSASNRRVHESHPPHPLARPVSRAKGPIRVAGISTTAMEKMNPRYSTSEHLLKIALDAAAKAGAETRFIALNKLRFNACGGFYSKDEHACTWPCTYSQIDPKDQLSEIYEALIFWADAVIIATPIRWGNASSLYYKMAERLNCIENQMLIANRSLVKNKVISFIITGGQDNVQSVAGQMLAFFSSLGFQFPLFPFIGTSRGWHAEDMANNVEHVRRNRALHKEAKELALRTMNAALALLKQ
ncbi:MAG: NAD(P)H-dependent oxidoreductase [Candidatus Omnitrophica bacterium]|nr:NAD(P)H-dependent oxidoreductase [Candidatus Omnitrophota bacterium]MCM8791263.1 NAD(P)H-dependent oxidoreductase [Candidatus Omnitrophota bacterium]